MGVPELPLPSSLTRRFRRTLSGPVDVTVRHRWPVDFRPPPSGHFVVMQPWEFGSIPRLWAEALAQLADEVWAPTTFVRDCFVQSGVPAERVERLTGLCIGTESGTRHLVVAPDQRSAHVRPQPCVEGPSGADVAFAR